METQGRIKGLSRDWRSNKMVISFEIDGVPSDIDDLTRFEELDITARRHREKRSLNANAYFHVLCQKIAEKTGNSMKLEYEDGMLLLDGLHVRVVSRDTETVKFGLMRGSHTYNTAEMARLIDGTVEDAKELGIETLTPMQIERMKAAWTGTNC